MNNFTFRYPPPPPLPLYTPAPPPPPPPVTTLSIAQPPPPPPQTTNANWENFDFSRPPPPVPNGLRNNTTNGISSLVHGYRVSSNSTSIPNLSPGLGQENSSYYGVNNDTSHSFRYRQNSVRRYRVDQYSTDQNWGHRNNLKKSRYDGQLEQKNDHSDRSYYRSGDTRYARITPVSDTRLTYTRSTPPSVEYNSSSDTKYQEEGGQRSKKRKKPLSLAVPGKKGWTEEEANMALEVEKEYNKLFKNHSLKIKFPDQELNREIVSKFHPSVETVYFQQPSNPRFCFVTLADGADPNAVIEELNEIKFGLGFLSAEYKKDREEEQNVGPEDIDPLTLYVGNLAQEVTKEDMVNFFPKNKRIDIGFAKKMRYTRYAFVSFKNVQDSIEAFKTTHYADLHSKSMIVRFRRLHGTVGMPGEPKVQHPSREIQDEARRTESSPVSSDQLSTANSEHLENNNDEIRYVSPEHSPKDSPLHNDSDRRTISECSDSSIFDPNLVKKEPYEYPHNDIDSNNLENDTEHYETSQQHSGIPQTGTRVPGSTSSLTENPESQNLAPEAIVKREPESSISFLAENSTVFPVIPFSLKKEPRDDEDRVCEPSTNDQVASDLVNGYKEPKKESENCEPNPEVNEEEFNITTDFGSVLDNLKKRQNLML